MFQEGHDAVAEQAYRQIARLSRGAYCRFDAGAVNELRELLRAVAAYASGGMKALEDPGVFTMPWSATITYGRPSGAWVEDVCAEGTANAHYAPQDEDVFPTANKPDF